MTNRKFLVIGAVLAALAGAALVLLYARGADARAESRYETVQVLRAIAPIEPGESIATAAQSREALPRAASRATRSCRTR